MPEFPPAIFFDFDGVIVESAEIKVEAFRALYSEYGDEVEDNVIAYHKAHEGISRVVKILHCHQRFLGIKLDPVEHQELCDRYAALVEEAVSECEEVPGATPFLRAHHHNSRFFVVSGTPEDELRRITERRGLNNYFEGVYGSPRNKDDIVGQILRTFGFDPARCLFVGDAMTDYRAAEAAGLEFFGRVREGGPDPFPDGTRIVRDLVELAEIIARG